MKYSNLKPVEHIKPQLVTKLSCDEVRSLDDSELERALGECVSANMLIANAKHLRENGQLSWERDIKPHVPHVGQIVAIGETKFPYRIIEVGKKIKVLAMALSEGKPVEDKGKTEHDLLERIGSEWLFIDPFTGEEKTVRFKFYSNEETGEMKPKLPTTKEEIKDFIMGMKVEKLSLEGQRYSAIEIEYDEFEEAYSWTLTHNYKVSHRTGYEFAGKGEIVQFFKTENGCKRNLIKKLTEFM